MNEYRTPAERQAQDDQEARVRVVLEQDVRDGASVKAAIVLGEPATVVEMWVNRFWNGLRDGLVDQAATPSTYCAEDRLAAIYLLINDRISAETAAMLRAVTNPSSDS